MLSFNCSYGFCSIRFCGAIDQAPTNYYGDIKGINLYVVIQSRSYEEAIRRHGKEKSCAGASSKPDDYIEGLKKTYNFYPTLLLRDRLTHSISEELKKHLSLIAKKNGYSAPINFMVLNDLPAGRCIDYYSEKEKQECEKKRVSDYTDDPDNLTVTATVSIENDLSDEGNDYNRHPYWGPTYGADPRIAVIAWEIYRPECMLAYGVNTKASFVVRLVDGEVRLREKLDQFTYSLGSFLE